MLNTEMPNTEMLNTLLHDMRLYASDCKESDSTYETDNTVKIKSL